MYLVESSSFVVLWLFALALSVVTALMEIQIEGGNGWAGCLPSWRFAPGWLRTFLNGKDITGYHVYLNLHLIILFHFPLVLMGWSWSLEFTVLATMLMCMVLEDFLWFILNPHFGWKNFRGDRIPWFTRWWGPLPIDYYFWLTLSALFAVLRGSSDSDILVGSFDPLDMPLQQLMDWGIGLLLVVFVIGFLIIAVTPRITRFLSKDTLPHPGHPGICATCAIRMPEEVVKKFEKVTARATVKRLRGG